MSYLDKIKAREEAAGRPHSLPAQSKPTQAPKPEVKQEEIEALNAELDSEIKTEIEPEEKELTPAELEARTKDSYEDEIKKLREENAKRRKKEQEAKEKALAMADEVFKSEREEYENRLAEMEKQLKAQKALEKEEIKVEKEIVNAESKAEQDALRKRLKELEEKNARIEAQIQAQKDAEENERSLRKQAAENRFKSMLKEIPSEFQDAASAMFKGYEDPSEGLIAITKFKAQGLFGKKTIEVVSRVPKEDKQEKSYASSKTEKFAKRSEAIKSRRQGIAPGQNMVGPKAL